MKISRYIGVFVALGTSVLFAAPGPIVLPSSGVLTATSIKVGPTDLVPTANYLSVSGLGGGGWEGQVNGQDTRFWCVDSQNYFSPGSSALANVVRLDKIASNSSLVRYGNVTEVGPPKWTNALGANPTDYSTATDRFRMAAYLVGSYDIFPATVNNTDRNRAIQHAVWAIMNNSTSGLDSGGISSTGASYGAYSVSSFITAAMNNYNSVNMGRWAVASWVVDTNGRLTSDVRQTFLVQVVPEPGFYGVLALGLSGVFLLVRRRRDS